MLRRYAGVELPVPTATLHRIPREAAVATARSFAEHALAPYIVRQLTACGCRDGTLATEPGGVEVGSFLENPGPQ